jgi:gamma-glutamyl-gamma-aminobutyraldehyde dehydrogenase/4-guanidinobutyraldehyde dehydrogenase/NAD-dependent aldehyde dehydrogenase
MSTTQWQDRAAELRIDARAFIDGERVDARSGARFDCLSPVAGRKLAEPRAATARTWTRRSALPARPSKSGAGPAKRPPNARGA